MYHANLNIDLMGKNVMQINDGITINADDSIKNVIYIWNPATRSFKNGKY